MDLLVSAVRMQIRDKISLTILKEVMLYFDCYIVLSYVSPIYSYMTSDDVDSLRVSLYYIDPLLLTALLSICIIINAAYIYCQLLRRSQTISALRTQYSEFCNDTIIMRIPTQNHSPALCYCKKGLFVVDKFNYYFIPIEAVETVRFYEQPQKTSFFGPLHLLRAKADPIPTLALKFQDVCGKCYEVKFNIKRSEIKCSELANLMLILRDKQ